MKLSAKKFFSLKEEQKLFKTLEESSEKASQVDLMLYRLLILSGLRISEALALKWSDIGEDYLTLANQKNGTCDGTVLIGAKLQAYLQKFREVNPYAHSSFLFNTQKGPYKRTNAHDRLKYWLSVSKVRSSLSLHSFRHTYATKALDAGLPLPLVKEQLRHSNIAITSVYLHYTQESRNKLNEVF